MNDQHGYAAGYDGYTTGAFDTTSFAADPLFGELPGASYDGAQTGSYATTQTAAYDVAAQSAGTGQWDSAQWSTAPADPYAAQHAASYETGSYDTTAMWATTGYQQLADIPAQSGPGTGEQWDATGQWQAQTQAYDSGAFGTGGYGTTAYDTGAYDATAWNSGDTTTTYDGYEAAPTTTFESPFAQEQAFQPEQPFQPEQAFAQEHSFPQEPAAEDAYGQQPLPEHEFSPSEFAGQAEPDEAYGQDDYRHDGDDDGSGPADEPAAAFTPSAHTPRAGGGRGRRKAPAKRSALLTVAVPSVCALGVAGVAAASVGLGSDQGETKTQSAPDPASVKPAAANSKLDTQLANLSADADDFADRASRTQERIDLKERQAAEKKRKAEEAARKEAMRPKFALPVKQQGLSAYYGQAGINWMSVHTGIDFPVSYGTSVLAATDGTVRTQWNSAYGNMAIVTAADGTETWYCHLSSTKIRSGSVKAGDEIAFSGNSGNSTGPHLHFEVRPGGGSAIDPLSWLRSHGLDPT
ncbi:peptidoglycan DD-metalloendopeptidase family protein [Streptomyces sp. NBC_01304]|uniref:peptidoglycan DD-metalloendopeptidase family protein n=1 Tax=Streptomyces sp. NBC_01304 TaxID=2903818 RepID=UPI002E0F83BB|nr:peptidoglycan DD-metalloendopeptidase family protein [Streptomyces sp. NBC_01304]